MIYFFLHTAIIYQLHSLKMTIYLFTYLLTNLLTYSMAQSPSWEANWFAASQEIPRISRNPKVHYRTHKRPPIKFQSKHPECACFLT